MFFVTSGLILSEITGKSVALPLTKTPAGELAPLTPIHFFIFTLRVKIKNKRWVSRGQALWQGLGQSPKVLGTLLGIDKF